MVEDKYEEEDEIDINEMLENIKSIQHTGVDLSIISYQEARSIVKKKERYLRICEIKLVLDSEFEHPKGITGYTFERRCKALIDEAEAEGDTIFHAKVLYSLCKYVHVWREGQPPSWYSILKDCLRITRIRASRPSASKRLDKFIREMKSLDRHDIAQRCDSERDILLGE